MNKVEETAEVAEFAAPWGTLLKVISFSVTGILCAISAGVGFYRWPSGSPTGWISLLPILIVLVCAVFTVRGYRLEPEVLRIRRLAWNTRLSLTDLQRVEYIPQVMQNSIRLLGNGGLFSFTGWFRNAQLGTYRAYVTDLQRVVVLHFDKRRVVVSPEDPARFVAAVRKMLTQRSRTGNASEKPSPSPAAQP